MSDQIKVQGQDSLIVLPWQKAPTASEAGKKLFHDYSESVVKIQNGLSTGTGWIGPDGRVVTAYHVIKGGSDLFAVTADGRRHRLGGRVSIDDVADIAALEIVGSATEGRPLAVASKSPEPGATVRTLGHPAGFSLHLSEGTFKQEISLSQRARDAGMEVPRPYFYDGRERASHDQFVNMNWLLSKIPCRHGNSGGPVFNDRNEVVSLCSMGKDGSLFAPARDRLVAVLERAPKDEPFINNGKYVNGFSRLILKADRQPAELLLEAGLAGIAALGFREFRPRSSNMHRGLATTLVLPYVAGQTYFDVSGYLNSASSADSTYYGLSGLADGGMLVGLAGTALSRVPQVHRAFKITALAAVAARAACELMPNHYVVSIERADKQDKRIPFLNHMIKSPLSGESPFSMETPGLDGSMKFAPSLVPIDAMKSINKRH